MKRPRGRAKLAGVLVACAVAVVGVIAALVVTKGGHESAPTTGQWAPITVKRPEVPIIAGGIPVDVEPTVERKDFSTALEILPGMNRYRITISNTSDVGTINSFQWYPPTGVQIVELLGSSEGSCTLKGLTGFGGNQFPTVVLRPNVLCEKVDLKAPSCTCLGDGGTVSISFVTDSDLGGGYSDVRMRTATLSRDRIPVYLKPGSTSSSSG